MLSLVSQKAELPMEQHQLVLVTTKNVRSFLSPLFGGKSVTTWTRIVIMAFNSNNDFGTFLLCEQFTYSATADCNRTI